MLDVSQVHKSYGPLEVLRGVDLTVASGEIVALLGRNGAGKSTLASIIVGLRYADSGSVRVDGEDVALEPHAIRSRIGFAPQETGVYAPLPVRENLRYFGRLRGLRRRALNEAVQEAVGAFDLEPLLGRRAGTLSGGEQRRVHTAMACVGWPRLLLLDEPTVGADVVQRSELVELVRRRAADGAAVCYSTHYLIEAETLGGSVAILDDGMIVARGTVADLVASEDAYVQFVFDGPAPPLDGDGVNRVGELLNVRTTEPERATAEVIAALGDERRRLRAVEVVRPSLETVFMARTGRRYENA